MSTEANKAIVTKYFERISAGDFHGALDLFAEDAQISFMSRTVMGYTKGKAEVVAMIAALMGLFPEGIQLSIHGITAEGDRVAVEAESHGKLADGRLYSNVYHYLFEVTGGQIRTSREYCCTAHVMERLGPLMAEKMGAAR
jgi:uncharacterized protein